MHTWWDPRCHGPPCAVTWLSCGPAFTVTPDLIHLRRTSSGQVFAHHLSSPFNPETLVYQPYCSDPFVATLLSGSLFPWLAYSQGLGFPRWLSGKESACQAGDVGSIPGVRKIPWRWKWQPTLVSLPGKFHGQGSLASYSPCGPQKIQT